MKKKTIEFRPRNASLDILPPRPASSFIPQWYKDTPAVADKVLTAKRCVPMIDSLSAGYIIPLPHDVHWDESKRDGNNMPYWSDAKTDLVSAHHDTQTEHFDINPAFGEHPYKWVSQWQISTPKGYSTLFFHPSNRTDLPFYSFSGFVDTDKHPLIVNFPFVIRDGFQGVIPKGTPMIQCIPVKREDWVMELEDMDKNYVYLKEYEVFNPPFGWYKRNFWQKKRYQ
jgi:hypothetical protein